MERSVRPGAGSISLSGASVVKNCPLCRQPLAAPLTTNPGPRFSPVQQQIYDMIQRSGKTGLTWSQIADRLYASRSDGGPDHAYRCILGSIYYINDKLKPFGLRVKQVARAGAYVLVQI